MWDREIIAMVIAVLVGLLLFAGGVCWLASVCDAISIGADIEAVTVIRASIVIGESEDVVGQVADINRSIAKYQRWDSIPIIGIFVSNRWQRIEPIALR